MPVSELLRRITSREITEWMAFSQLEPFGADAGFLGHGITSATVANANWAKGQKAYTAEDFMPAFEGKKKQTVEEMIQFAQIVTIGMGGKDLRNKEK